MQPPLRFGLIGTGDVAGRWHAPALRDVPDATLHAVLSRNPARATAFAAQHGAAKAYSKLEAFLDDPKLGAVIVATPDALHAKVAIMAAAAGKHVLVEKPMATTIKDAKRMIAAARQHQVKLGVAYHHRWHAGLRQLVQLQRTGDLPPISELALHWSYPAANALGWRANAPTGRWWSMAALGTHAIDLASWLMTTGNDEPTIHAARFCDDQYKTGRDESAYVTLVFPNGTEANIWVSAVSPKQNRIDFIDDAGGWSRCDNVLGPHGQGEITVDGQLLTFEPVNPYAAQIANFVTAIRKDSVPEVTGQQGLRNLALLIEAEQAAHQTQGV